jgi:hypothetical protein
MSTAGRTPLTTGRQVGPKGCIGSACVANAQPSLTKK